MISDTSGRKLWKRNLVIARKRSDRGNLISRDRHVGLRPTRDDDNIKAL